MARPTKYTPELIEKTKDYIANYKDYGDTVPSVAGLSVEINVNRDTIYDWVSQVDKQEFSDMVGKILSKQERELLNRGLDGKFNSNITKLMLAKHGYHDKQEIDQTIKGEVQFINDIPRNKNSKST